MYKISKTHRKPETKPFIEDNRIGLKYKSMKSAQQEYRASIGPKMDFEGSRRQYHYKGWFTEEGVNSQKGVFARVGKRKGFDIAYYKKRKLLRKI